ncbi:MAG TPA: hypothetical protein VNM47_08090 [Terriglobia bacterium]|nr:hypothetical protein [Terriglobia bacterium]
MQKKRRQFVERVIAAGGIGLVALDVVLYLAAYRPLASDIVAAQQHYTQARIGARIHEARVSRLEKFKAALPQAAVLYQDFADHRTSPRRRAFSTAAELLRMSAQSAAVQPPSVTYKVDSKHHDPLKRVGLEITTEGSYEGLVKFAHALETANDFLLIRGFSLGIGDKGTLTLRLFADLYVTP